MDDHPKRKIGTPEFQNILDSHSAWIRSDRSKGEQADLSSTDLRGLQQSGVSLPSADISNSNLAGAVLRRANLRGCNFTNSNLIHADLTECNLQDADLTDVTGLLASQLAGTDVTGAKLPAEINNFSQLRIIEERSRHAKNLFLTLLAGITFSALTLAKTSDAQLILNASSSTLPVIGTTIPLAGFFVAAPLLLFAVFVYLHIYLQRLWEELADLPARFPDGRPLDKVVYPWLMNGLVRAHFFRLKNYRPHLSQTQVWISEVLAWWLFPITCIYFWGKYLPRHDWGITSFHIILILMAVGTAINFHFRMTYTLRRVSDYQPVTRKMITPVGLFAVALCTYLFVSLSVQNINHSAELGTANLFRASLKQADLRDTNLRGAEMSEVNAQQTDFGGAELNSANLTRAVLKGANLRWANLEGANLLETDLRGADLRFSTGLTAEQLCVAYTDSSTTLSEELSNFTRKAC